MAELAAPRQYRGKRLFDLVAGLCGVGLSGPLWPVLALAVRLDSPGPVLFRAQRIGRDGRPFTLLKFRTMRTEPGEGLAVTRSGDPRITRSGRLLRLTKFDELPQLINVIRGDMSIVGPRPEDPKYVARYDERQRAVLRARPGITGAAAVAYRHEEALLAAAADPEKFYVEQVMPAKLALELAYVSAPSLRADLRLIVETALAIVR